MTTCDIEGCESPIVHRTECGNCHTKVKYPTDWMSEDIPSGWYRVQTRSLTGFSPSVGLFCSAQCLTLAVASELPIEGQR